MLSNSINLKKDFKKLSGLSSEGRSTSTTLLTVSSLRHASEGGIDEMARKILSFTDNRQDASLQAGHFNDFIRVSLLRSGIYNALEKHGELKYDEIADEAVKSMNLGIQDISSLPNLDPYSALAKDIQDTFTNLTEFRIYEDLRRGWRVIQPNLEQCGLLKMVHMRNVPPTPANYAQRSGRAGRWGDPALVLTYCSGYSGHDQYFFHHRNNMVAGSVRPPELTWAMRI